MCNNSQNKMVKLKKGDFISITFIGKIKETGQIFDLNDAEDAKKNDLYDPKQKYGPAVVCIGQGDVVKGLDEAFVGKEVGKELTVEVNADNGFGKRDAKQIKLLSASRFAEQEIKPYPGMPVSLNGKEGVIKTVSGGRIMVDFNHPLAGRNLEYQVKINKIVEDDTEKVKGFMQVMVGNDMGAYVENNEAYVNLDLPKEALVELEKKLKERLPNIKKIEKATEKKDSKAEKQSEKKAEASKESKVVKEEKTKEKELKKGIKDDNSASKQPPK